MIIYLLVLLLISNAVAINQNKSILYSRFIMVGLLSISTIIYNNLYIKPLENGIGLYNGLFNISILNQSFGLFILLLSAIIAILTSFYYRKAYYIMANSVKNYTTPGASKLYSYINLFFNKNASQFSIIEYSLIILFVLSGAIFLISVGDLVSLFLSIELQSYGLYILATIYRNSESATGSGLTYFLLGGLSSCFILLGSAILYVNSGMTNLDNIYLLNSINELTYNIGHATTVLSDDAEYTGIYYSYFSNNGTLNYVNFSLIILIVGLLFKISAAPFHFWSPDVYDGIPTVVTTFVATIAKISLLILMLELVSYSSINTDNIYDSMKLSIENTNINEGIFEWKNILILSSLMSLVIGSLLGLTQYRIKRLFAYSTISHVGFILLALSINKLESIQAYLFYILQYSLCNLNTFFILITIGCTLYEYVYKPYKNEKIESSKLKNLISKTINKSKDKFIDIDNSPIQLLSQIKGYFYINSFLSISFAITLFSFVGIPPLVGFFAKQMVLSAALDEGYIFITLVAVITSVIGAAYYLNIIKLIFFSESDYVAKAPLNNLVINNRENIPLGSLKESHDGESVGINSKSKEELIFEESTVSVNDKLSITISVLTLFISLFIFMPDEWFRIVNILSLSINKC